MYEDNVEIIQIAGRLTYKTLQEYIKQYRLNASDMIYLHTHDYDDLVLDYRARHGIAMPGDLRIFDVKVKESRDVPRNCFKRIKKKQKQKGTFASPFASKKDRWNW